LENQPQHTPHIPRLPVDGNAIIARLETLARADLCPRCARVIDPVAADAIQLFGEVIRLHEALIYTRLESANRLAAIRAALHAAQEGEPDPLAYLRDELPGSDEIPGMGGRRGR
jgi:hypothetical protein